MRMIRWMWVVTKLERMRGSRKWEKRETLRRKEADENGSKGRGSKA